MTMKIKMIVLAAGCFCLAWLALDARPADAADVRRAFVVGVERYGDGEIQKLSRAVTDANDFAGDLEQIGFDRKNITVATDIRTKADFQKRFDAFLKTIEEGDIVVFYFSGHGLGVESSNTNFLLLGDLKSLFTHTKAKLPDADRRNANVVKLRMTSFSDSYETEEIPRSGVSVQDVARQIGEKKPKVALMLLDACRSLASVDRDDNRRIQRGAESGSRLVPSKNLPEGFLALYSASFGEQAVESFGASDRRRNSLFTEVLRSEMLRPGQNLIDLADRVRLTVRAIASNGGRQQEPEYYQHLAGADDFVLVGGVGAERFQISDDKCDGAGADWEQLRQLPTREALQRHQRRFDGCKTAELARQRLVTLVESSDDPAARPATVGSSRQIDDCDRLAASESDRARPPEVPGVPFDKISVEEARAACAQAIARNPRIVRFLFNLGRAEQAALNGMRSDDPERKETMSRARAALDDAAKRGYLAAMNNLAILYDSGVGVENEQDRATDLLKRAAQQGYPPAMYNLGLRYMNGEGGVQRDIWQGYEWLAKAAESGSVSAMVATGQALWTGRGVITRNPRRAVEWYQQAAESGSTRAKFFLGEAYLFGNVLSVNNERSPNSVARDYSLALLWFGRAAEAGEPTSQYWLAYLMENGFGLSNPQPQIAERYYRLSAYGGDQDAEVEFAEKLRTDKVLTRPENGQEEGVKLLKRALSQGSVRAALYLARIHRLGQFGLAKQPIEAMRYAYQAIKLATEADPTTTDGNPYYEIAAGIMLSEMAKTGEAIDAGGQPLLSKDEIDRLERFYGKVDDATRQVKVRRLRVPLRCIGYTIGRDIWVWDWGRNESPTEPQFRNLERKTPCNDNKELRDTLIASFVTARKSNVPFADLIEQQIKAAVEAPDEQRGRRRRR